MPNLLKRLVKPRRQAPSSAIDLLASPTRATPRRSDTDELTDLAQRVLGKLDSRDAQDIGTSDRLSQQVDNRVLHRQAKKQGKSKSKKEKIKSVVAPAPVPNPVTQRSLGGDDAQKVLAALLGSISMSKSLHVLLVIPLTKRRVD